MAARRAAGEPLQYVLGSWAFRKLELTVDPRVLIPRPETEQVVEIALGELARLASEAPLTVADLGTGSGAIACSLALEGPAVPNRFSSSPKGSEQPGLVVWATDISAAALEVASANVARLAAEGSAGSLAASRVRLARGSWFEALPADLAGALNLVVSNPPYVSAAELSELPAVVRDYEPRSALIPAEGAGGFEAIGLLVRQAIRWLTAPGALVIEIAPHQARQALDAARAAGFSAADIHPDLAGRPRALVARVSG
jgi:release factor glutamine methyltransferase